MYWPCTSTFAECFGIFAIWMPRMFFQTKKIFHMLSRSMNHLTELSKVWCGFLCIYHKPINQIIKRWMTASEWRKWDGSMLSCIFIHLLEKSHFRFYCYHGQMCVVRAAIQPEHCHTQCNWLIDFDWSPLLSRQVLTSCRITAVMVPDAQPLYVIQYFTAFPRIILVPSVSPLNSNTFSFSFFFWNAELIIFFLENIQNKKYVYVYSVLCVCMVFGPAGFIVRRSGIWYIFFLSLSFWLEKMKIEL